MKSVITISFLVLVLAFSYGAAYAFHDGGVAYCAGCHTMHASQNGTAVDPTHPEGHEYLLKVGNASDQCLACHANYGQFFGGAGFGPGGDFYWLTKTYTYDSHGLKTIKGESHGHNIISPAKGLVADLALTDAPGGDFLSARLGCTSCHDPHGNESFRLLYGDDGPGPIYNGGRYDFDYPAPLAKGNSRTTTFGNGDETDIKHTVYKSGMSNWCANCHPDLHADLTSTFVHPEGDMGGTIAGSYNAYVNSDDLTTGDEATSYRSLTPFEAVNVDLATVNSLNYTQGPTGVDQVMCLTCHRAHASAFPDAGRWDFAATFIAESHPMATDGGVGANDATNKYYTYTFVHNQRSLCNKCHAKDFGDEPNPAP